MNIFRKTYIFAAAGLFLSMLASCDNIPEGNRYIEGEAVVAERNVLLIDFTGQNCINCPEAHAVIEQLEEQYEDKLIVVSVHCGGFGISVNRTNFEKGRVGLMTAEGQAIMEAYGIEQFPMGVVDFGSPQEFTQWPTTIRDELQKPTDVTIDLTAKYVPDEKDGEGYYGNITMSANVMSSEEQNVYLQFWIIESGIVAEQRTLGSQTITDYVHNNVFRTQIYDGLKGKSVSLAADMESSFDAEISTRWTDKEHWDVNNLAVVCIVSNDEGTLQVVRTSIIPKSETESEN